MLATKEILCCGLHIAALNLCIMKLKDYILILSYLFFIELLSQLNYKFKDRSILRMAEESQTQEVPSQLRKHLICP